MRIGVAYYPEHWPEDRWPVDARLMKETGIELVRLGEFAWSWLEPRRLQFAMEGLERAISVFAQEELQVLLCTPTASPPPWLFGRHPSMLAEDSDGRKWFRGSRRDICLNNRPYRRYARRIVREVARAFGQNAAVVAWQVDSRLGDLGSGRCYCDDCEQAFREWLKRRYGTIERLNRLWLGEFWSQHFNDWSEIPVPRRTPGGTHPALALEYERFISAAARDFISEQRQLIGEYGGGSKPLTANSLGLATDQMDQFSLESVQDVLSVDNCPVGKDPAAAALRLDLTRSVKRKPFWVLGQQSGEVADADGCRQPRPGQLRLWTYQAVARGAELVSFCRWHTPAAGQEMHHQGMLDPDGALRRRYDELKATIAELKANAGLWEGKLPRARVALVLDYQSHWALAADSMGADIDYLDQFRALYGLLWRMGVAVDVIAPQHDPAGYAMLVAPMPVICRPQDAQLWHTFVAAGGVLVVTAPAGYRNEQNGWNMSPPPGPLGELLGIEVVEHDVLGRGGETVNQVVWGDAEFPARALASIIELHGAGSLATYAGQYYAGRPAVTCRPQGEGTAYFLGTLSTAALYEQLLHVALERAGVETKSAGTGQLEFIPLAGGPDEAPLEFVLNHSEGPCELTLPAGKARVDLLTGRKHEGRVVLEAFGVALLQG